MAERGANLVVINPGALLPRPPRETLPLRTNRSPRLLDVHLSSLTCSENSRFFRFNYI
jgi:hypothetical protein